MSFEKITVGTVAATVLIAISASAPAKAMPLSSGLTAGDHPIASESLVTEVKGRGGRDGRGGKRGGKRGKRDNDLIDIDIGGGKKDKGLLGGLL